MKDEKHGSGWASGGAIIAAALASACCILPVFFGGLGVSALAVAVAFEPLRPYLIAAAAILLAVGFYYAYFRRAHFGRAGSEGAACDVPSTRGARLGRPMLWLATVAVLTLGLFPSYAGLLTGESTGATVASERVASRTLSLSVEGMTCEACAVGIERELASVAGVLGATVSYGEKSAAVVVDLDAPPSGKDLLAAVERAGYRAAIVTQVR